MNNDQNMNGFNPNMNQMNNNQPMNGMPNPGMAEPMNNMPNPGMAEPMNNMPNPGMAEPMNNMPNPGMPGQMNNMPNPGMPGQMNKKKLNPLFIAIPVIVVIAVVVAFVFLGNDNYKEPIELYCQAANDLDFSKIEKAVPEEFLKNDSEVSSLKTTFESTKSLMDTYGITLSVSCEISDGTKISDEDLDDLNEEFQDEYDTSRKISKAYKVNVKSTTTSAYEGEKETETDEDVFVVGKIDGKWYFLYTE